MIPVSGASKQEKRFFVHPADWFSSALRLDISITSHSCALRSLLAILNHAPISLETGEMIPVVVKATRKK